VLKEINRVGDEKDWMEKKKLVRIFIIAIKIHLLIIVIPCIIINIIKNTTRTIFKTVFNSIRPIKIISVIKIVVQNIC
jgi:hypothetical protein